MAKAVTPGPLAPSPFVLPLYMATMFLSAALLFVIQPMFTKMVLPRFGGAPAVWSVAMVFFQGVLLLGYAYADVLTQWLPGGLAVCVHLAVTLAGGRFLPLAIVQGWSRPPADGASVFLLGLCAVSIGLPFFALSANSPLLQAWFARSGHKDAVNPYFLYAASNVGSLLALFAYPFVVEPLAALSVQTVTWSYGYDALIVLIAACGLGVFGRAGGHATLARAARGGPPPTLRRMTGWVLLALVPSALLVAVTAHITTDIAAAPFLWVLPLSLYLVTFILVFRERALVRQAWLVQAQPWLFVLLAAVLALDIRTWLSLDMSLHLVTFFVTAMICHGMIACGRPAAEHLTRFYCCLSLGGVLGGIFAGLAAPRLFSWIAEYPILIALAALCRPGLTWPHAHRERTLWLGSLVAAGMILAPGVLRGAGIPPLVHRLVLAGALALLACGLCVRHVPLRLAGVLAAVFLLTRVYPPNVRELETIRSFFGVHKIELTQDGQFRILRHGTELHGAQRIRDEDGQLVTGRPELLTYYHPDSPIAQAMRAARAKAQGPMSIGVLGLGTGSIACLTEAGDSLDYYEIDPDVIRIARDPQRFRFLQDCAPQTKITLGDARLTLADARYDILFVDAFSSDAIPIHLLTREALALYLVRIVPGGLIIVHISNNHLHLQDVVAATAATQGLLTRINDEDVDPEAGPMINVATVAALAKDAADFGTLSTSEDWPIEPPNPHKRPWTDEYANLLGALIGKLRAPD